MSEKNEKKISSRLSRDDPPIKHRRFNESTSKCFRCAQFQQGRTVDALTLKDEEGRCRVRKASVRSQTIYDPGVSE